jgi:hypothetical protein
MYHSYVNVPDGICAVAEVLHGNCVACSPVLQHVWIDVWIDDTGWHRPLPSNSHPPAPAPFVSRHSGAYRSGHCGGHPAPGTPLPHPVPLLPGAVLQHPGGPIRGLRLREEGPLQLLPPAVRLAVAVSIRGGGIVPLLHHTVAECVSTH